MAQKKSIIFKGIQRALPQSLMPDGACQEIINLRPRKGAWRPVGTKKVHKSIDLSTYSKVWLHDIENGINEGQPNWIGLKSAIEVSTESLYARSVELGWVGTYISWLSLFSNYSTQISDADAAYQMSVDDGYSGTFATWLTPFTSTLYLINSETGLTTLIESVQGSSINVSFLKRTMLVTSDTGLLVYLFTSDKVYTRVADLPIPRVNLSLNGKVQISSVSDDPGVIAMLNSLGNDVQTDRGSVTAEGLLGEFFAALNNTNMKDGKVYGSLMYISAYRLFDGSYVFPTIPKYIETGNGGIIIRTNPDFGSSDDRKFIFLFDVAALNATISNTLYPASFESTKDLIESVCIFATKVTPLFQIDKDIITDDLLNSIPWDSANRYTPFSKKLSLINEDFKDLAKSTGWYKIHEFNFEDIIGKPGYTTKEVDTKGFYQDYATRETLPTDQFTHHKLIGREAYVYNDRVHLANIKTLLGKPYIQWSSPIIPNEGPQSGANGTVNVWLKTSLGQSVRQSSLVMDTIIPIYNNSSKAFAPFFLIPHLVGYNDARAYKMQITVNLGGSNYEIFNESLVKNETMNFAYWHSSVFDANELNTNANFNLIHKYTSVVQSTYPAITLPAESELPFDTNRVQVSEIQNPLIFPAKYSYQIGTGKVLKICSGSEPLSTGQFGQFPLQIFTSKGIWALEIGSGDILYSNVLPVNGEVINNPDNVISLSQGVCYTTDTGLYVINGRQVTELSEVIEQPYNNMSLTSSNEVLSLVTDARFVSTLANALSNIPFITYLKGSSVGYEHLNKELFITNKEHGYSYVYSFESQLWYKISTSYRLLINSYPKLLGVTSTNIVSISDESDTDPVDCLVITASQSLESPDAYKKIEQAILRGLTHSSNEACCGFYVFGSNDLVTWKFLIGNQRSGIGVKDYLTQRTHGSAKYYAFIFAGRITTSSEIKQIEIIFNIKWNNRLR